MKTVFPAQWCGRCFCLRSVSQQGNQDGAWRIELDCGHAYQVRRGPA